MTIHEDADELDVPEDGYPALFLHCRNVYNEMLVQGVPHDEDDRFMVYTGFTTHLFKELELSVPYYTKVMQILREMDCVRQISRGGGPAQSQWLLVQEPDFDKFNAAKEKLGLGRGLRASKISMLEQQVRDLSVNVAAVLNATTELTERVSTLERQRNA